MSNAPLRVACAHCQSKFQVADQLVRGKLVKFRCKRCKGTIEVDGRTLVVASAALLPHEPDTSTQETPTRMWRASTSPTSDMMPSAHSEPPERLSMSDGLGDGLASFRPPTFPELRSPSMPDLRAPSVPDLTGAMAPLFPETETGTLSPLLTAPPTTTSDHRSLAFDPRLLEPRLSLASAPPKRRPSAWMGAVALLLVAGSAAAVLATRTTNRAPSAESPSTQGIQPSDFQGVTAEPPPPSSAAAHPATRARDSVEAPAPSAIAAVAMSAPAGTLAARPVLPSAARPAARRVPETESNTDEPANAERTPEPAAALAPAATAAAATAPSAPDTDEPEGPAFDTGAARAALEEATGSAASCKNVDTPAGPARIAVTFAPTGRVTTAEIESGPFVGTTAGGCVASKFRAARVPPFGGEAVTVHKTVSF